SFAGMTRGAISTATVGTSMFFLCYLCAPNCHPREARTARARGEGDPVPRPARGSPCRNFSLRSLPRSGGQGSAAAFSVRRLLALRFEGRQDGPEISSLRIIEIDEAPFPVVLHKLRNHAGFVRPLAFRDAVHVGQVLRALPADGLHLVTI